ncbi:histone-lysine N-methyltransferase PRDM9-like isoform X2 [Takifugu rubripes]|uniref:histone-lysine N-methyltransferase PRDM9-like isoform X2 n=1 Tax=Takifugu rubripes TaxID=31033 RepID=UPI00114545FA|nr:histone-lysine N-methyltransferase PRDM9-like isoform X2 [Takifugu rubripes]
MLLSIDQDHDPSEYLTLDLNLDDSLQKTLAIMSVMNSEESEPNLQLFSHSTHEDSNHKGDQQNDSGSTLRKQNHPQHKDFQGQHFVMCKEEDGEVLINQGHWNTERNAGLDPEDTKPQHMKEEHLRITAEEVVLKQETDASLSPPSSEVYREVQTLNPDKTTKQSVTKLPLLNPVMSEPNSDPLLLLSTSCREDKVIGQRKTRRGGSRSTKQDKNITQPRQRAGEKPYVCLTCKKGFLRKKSLRDHMTIHTGLQPHVCVTCEKGFILKKDFTAHIRTHNAEKHTR